MSGVNLPEDGGHGPMSRIIRFCLENKFIVTLFVLLTICWGVMVRNNFV